MQNQSISKRKVISFTAIKLALLSILYYTMKTIGLEGFVLALLFSETIGYILIFIIQAIIVHKAIIRYYELNISQKNLTTHSAIIIAVLSYILGRLISTLSLIVLANVFSLQLATLFNTLSIAIVPVAMVYAALTGLVVGVISARAVKRKFFSRPF